MKTNQPKDKNLAQQDWLEMISHSWTWQKLTVEERAKFVALFAHPQSNAVMKGNYEQRYEACQALYYAFLVALGYADDPMNWRDSEENPIVSEHYELNYKHHGLEFKPLTITDKKQAISLYKTAQRDTSNKEVTLTKVRIITTRMEVK